MTKSAILSLSSAPAGQCFHLELAGAPLINTFKACLTLKRRMNCMKMLIQNLFDVVYSKNSSQGSDSRFETF